MARDLAALRQNVDQLIASQNQMARQMARLQSDLVDVLLKMPEPQRRERQ
jgi:cell division protein FtsB